MYYENALTDNIFFDTKTNFHIEHFSLNKVDVIELNVNYRVISTNVYLNMNVLIRYYLKSL